MTSPSVLLDLDGTLIDSHAGIQASCLAALRALGHEPAAGFDIRASIGPPLEQIMRDLLRSFGDDRVEEGVVAYRRHYGEVGLFASTPYAGIGDALAGMGRRGWRLYLATSKREDFARRILEHIGFMEFFDGVHGSGPNGERAHKPELLAHIVAAHGLAPSNGVMVGDRRYDVLGAKSVGMRSLGALWGYGDRQELDDAGADATVARPSDLLRSLSLMLG